MSKSLDASLYLIFEESYLGASYKDILSELQQIQKRTFFQKTAAIHEIWDSGSYKKYYRNIEEWAQAELGGDRQVVYRHKRAREIIKLLIKHYGEGLSVLPANLHQTEVIKAWHLEDEPLATAWGYVVRKVQEGSRLSAKLIEESFEAFFNAFKATEEGARVVDEAMNERSESVSVARQPVLKPIDHDFAKWMWESSESDSIPSLEPAAKYDDESLITIVCPVSTWGQLKVISLAAQANDSWRFLPVTKPGTLYVDFEKFPRNVLPGFFITDQGDYDTAKRFKPEDSWILVDLKEFVQMGDDFSWIVFGKNQDRHLFTHAIEQLDEGRVFIPNQVIKAKLTWPIIFEYF